MRFVVLKFGATIPYPPKTSDYHYEVELVLAVGKGGRNIAPETLKTTLGLCNGPGYDTEVTRRIRP